MSANQSNPVVTLHEEPSNWRRRLVLFVPSVIGSVVFHLLLLGAFVAYLAFGAPAQADRPVEAAHEQVLQADDVVLQKRDFEEIQSDPMPFELNPEAGNNSDRKEDINVPGKTDPLADPGLINGEKGRKPVDIPPPVGYGNGAGGSVDWAGKGNTNIPPGLAGGNRPFGVRLEGSMFGRSDAARKWAVDYNGGTGASEAAVAMGLQWLRRQQMADGRWMLNSPSLADKDRGEANDIAGTALGLLPFLAAGKTHKPAVGNKDDKLIDKGLKFLLRSQDPKTGYFGGGMYAHGLATIVLCEAYGLSQDPVLSRPAQHAVTLLVNIQHEGGGWRYSPNKAPGDLSISGWQMMALKSAQMAGLEVPTLTLARAKLFLNNHATPDEGYTYLKGGGSTPRMTAVGLLCRQYMDGWGPAHPRMIKAIQTHIKTNAPDRKDVYYYYYATQVMHHFGGDEWHAWNEKMREYLIKTQEVRKDNANFGSWSPDGDQWGRAGGRLMMTSLNLLTLEVYYRYLPLYYRDAGYKMDKAVQK